MNQCILDAVTGSQFRGSLRPSRGRRLGRAFHALLLISCIFFGGFSLLVSGDAAAQTQFRVGGRTITITKRSSTKDVKTIIAAVEGGRALIVTRGRTSLRIGEKSLTLPSTRGRSASLTLNTKSRNLKIAGLTSDILSELNALLNTITNNFTLPPPRVFATIYRSYSGLSCNLHKLEIAKHDEELRRLGVQVNNSFCAVPVGNTLPASRCDQSVVLYRMHLVDRNQVTRATQALFTPVEWLVNDFTIVDCPNDRTVDMAGSISNVSCQPTSTTIESIDNTWQLYGLKVLEASCGMERAMRPPVCGQPEITYRAAKIYEDQKPLALSLGLRDRSEYSNFVEFGKSCPAPRVVTPVVPTVQMVGVISNSVCNPPRNTVASYDAVLSYFGIKVLEASCGFSSKQNPYLCTTVYRLVTIAQSQEALAFSLGLFRKEFVDKSVTFGQACPQ